MSNTRPFELIDLLLQAPNLTTIYGEYEDWEEAANDLIANGVTIQGRGKWEIHEGTALCSNCYCENRHIPVRTGTHEPYIAEEDKPHYCENCGAQMNQED